MPAMREVRYVYANSDVLVQWGGSGACVTLHRGSVWYADDPFVAGRPELFDRTPPIVHSTVDRDTVAPTPLANPKRRTRD